MEVDEYCNYGDDRVGRECHEGCKWIPFSVVLQSLFRALICGVGAEILLKSCDFCSGNIVAGSWELF